ncbi:MULTISPECIES: hypothetical protein [Rhodococcus]|jgi:hypothetical protein|uniref:hypothetical protein n=1 Tax=Rhodococcus sp. T9N TaxID=627445 RepID=UPI0021C2D02A|nr:hypothetical protein [Rhodococcus sp. T9N]
MDLDDAEPVVWTESEAREAWWRAILGISTAAPHFTTSEAEELLSGNYSTATGIHPHMSNSSVDAA